ncbi:MerR family transcriptional regulator [Erwinia sp. S38]|uniref:MerR family transcriptional regulator n=1 Tax=Erwinia sp. S38 TaxID=2769338 RepID=UPI00190CDFEA|nr:MerR family transcriptional regulator [Erwinia sp. S38]MBJ9999823.1 MerR family transcriptional regulator [Erwinia sp. S38]
MQIGKLASLTGVSIRMLRYYETAGLLHPTRSGTNYRHFSQEDVETVRRVLMLNAAGFTLPVIRSLLNCVSSGSAPCEALQVKVHEQLDVIERQMADLDESRGLLKGLLGR